MAMRLVWYVVQIALFAFVVGTGPMGARAQGADDLAALHAQVRQLYGQGKYAEAIPMAERYVALARQKHSEEHTEFATATSLLAALHQSLGRYSEAERLLKRALAIIEKALGPDHPDVAESLNSLALLYHAQGRYAEAEPLHRRAYTIVDKVLGPDHPTVASLNNLANLNANVVLLYQIGRYSEAIMFAQRAVALAEHLHGPEHRDLCAALNALAELYRARGHAAEAEPLYQRALAVTERALGADHLDVGAALKILSELYESQGRYAEAEPLMKRALAITETALGAAHPDVGVELNALAFLYYTQGRTAEAEPLYRRALTLTEKALGPDHRNVGAWLSNLAELYRSQGRTAEAEPLQRRALTITEKALGPDHPDVAASLNSLALLHHTQGRYADAEPLYRRVLAITETELGAAHPNVGGSLSNLAGLYRAQGRYAEAEPLMKRALAITETALGAAHPNVGHSLSNLAELYRSQGRYAEAEPLYQRALTVTETALGTEHPLVGQVLSNLADHYFVQRDWVRAADFWRRSTSLIVRRAQRGTHDPGSRPGRALTAKMKGEAEQEGHRFWGLVKVVHRLVLEGRGTETRLASEMFQTAQWAQSSEAAQSLAQMAARQAKGDGALARVVRERQDLVAEWRGRDKQLIAAVSQPTVKRNTAAEQEHRTRLAVIDGRIAEIDKALAKDFPDYAALVSPAPLSVEDVQTQLGTNEALVLVLDTPPAQPLPEETFIWVVTKTDSRWVRSDLGTPSLKREVGALRCGLDATLWQRGDAQRRCIELLKGTRLLRVIVNGQVLDILPFDLERAHALYNALLGPVEDMIKGKHLLIVPSGALTSLPFHVLVTAPTKTKVPRALAEFRKVAWLGTRQPITVLPSVASLKALRQFAKTSQASKTYLGIGNPLLVGPDPTHAKRAQAARTKQQCPKTSSPPIALATGSPLASFAMLFRGDQADIEEVRHWTPLPETADELCQIGRRLGVPESQILLGSRATEAALKDLSAKGRLSEYAILHFATHGALTGEVQGSAEPGLILTPPAKGTTDAKALERDDGFLTASEIATLKLDADWVILSACNTAGASGETAEPLSGMARAFFYAGARALLVSHWEVGSYAAVKLTTRAFTELKADPTIGRAEALRRSMRELIEKGSLAEAHPSMWAPFVVVGEGAAAR